MVDKQIAGSPHYFRLASVPFGAIASGHKTIESRLYDKKRQAIQLGDTIIFVHKDNPRRTVAARVVGLLRYMTFRDLFMHNDPEKFGGPNVEWLEKQINEFYSVNDQRKYGVIGIEFALVSSD